MNCVMMKQWGERGRESELCVLGGFHVVNVRDCKLGKVDIGM